MDWFQLTHRV